jgi:hypothetical protein
MAQQTPTPTPNTASAGSAEAAKAAASSAAHTLDKPDQLRTPSLNTDPSNPAAQTDNDPIGELLQHLQRAQPVIADLDRNLAQTIHTLTQQGVDPERRAQPAFRHQVAYALQDLERLPVWPIQMAPELRAEMTRLAVSGPGLENERMQALMRATASLEDKRLISDIRRAGTNIGNRVDQNTPDIKAQIEVLENRVRLSQHPIHSPPEPSPPTAEADGANTPRRPDAPVRNNPAQQSPSSATQQPYVRGALDTIFRGMRPKDPGPGAPWDSPPTPMAGRLAAFESQMQEGRDARALGRAEKSGRAALDALDAFRLGEGAVVMNRIREAARSEPGGIGAVLSEMRAGGRFADLRQQFNNALEKPGGASLPLMTKPRPPSRATARTASASSRSLPAGPTLQTSAQNSSRWTLKSAKPPPAPRRAATARAWSTT